MTICGWVSPPPEDEERGMRRARWMGLAVAAGLLGAAAPPSPPPPPEIAIPQPRVFPESITATRDGTLIVGSAGNGTIWRARPGDKAATIFIAPDSSGLVSEIGRASCRERVWQYW